MARHVAVGSFATDSAGFVSRLMSGLPQKRRPRLKWRRRIEGPLRPAPRIVTESLQSEGLEPTWSANCIRTSSPFGRHFAWRRDAIPDRLLRGPSSNNARRKRAQSPSDSRSRWRRSLLLQRNRCSLVQRQYSPPMSNNFFPGGSHETKMKKADHRLRALAGTIDGSGSTHPVCACRDRAWTPPRRPIVHRYEQPDRWRRLAVRAPQTDWNARRRQRADRFGVQLPGMSHVHVNHRGLRVSFSVRRATRRAMPASGTPIQVGRLAAS
jgi:hypothetical protein